MSLMKGKEGKEEENNEVIIQGYLAEIKWHFK